MASAQQVSGLGRLLESWLGANAADQLTVLSIVLGLVAGALGYLLISRPAARQALRVERSQAYLQLELASIEVFKYKSEKAYAIHWAITGGNPKRQPLPTLEEEVDQYHYQCLNLFEVASRFRRAKIIEPAVYASWIAWFIEVIEVDFFRRQWKLEYRDNYTTELQAIFDHGVELWDKASPAASPQEPAEQGQPGDADGEVMQLRKAFYAFVGWQLGCPVIANWLVQHERRPSWYHELGHRAQLTRLSLARTFYRLKRPDQT